MTQHDLNIANQTFPSTRTDLNNAILALASNNSGSVEPTTTTPGMLFVDTANNVLKQRNLANNGWNTLFPLDNDGANILRHTANPNGAVAGSFIGQPLFDYTNKRLYNCLTAGNAGSAVWTPALSSPVSLKTGNFTVTETDFMKLISCSSASAIAVTLPQATSGGGSNFFPGFFFSLHNRGTSTVTITPSTSTIDGASSLTLSPGQGATIHSDGTNYYTQRTGVATGSLVLISTQDASNSSSIDFTSGLDNTYDEYEIHHIGVTFATNAIEYLLQVSTDAGSSWKSGASDYNHGFIIKSVGVAAVNYAESANDTKLNLTPGGTFPVSNSAAHSLNGVTKIYTPTSTAKDKLFDNVMAYQNSAGSVATKASSVGSYKGTTDAVNGVRLYASSGNIASGHFKLYGVAK